MYTSLPCPQYNALVQWLPVEKGQQERHFWAVSHAVSGGTDWWDVRAVAAPLLLSGRTELWDAYSNHTHENSSPSAETKIGYFTGLMLGDTGNLPAHSSHTPKSFYVLITIPIGEIKWEVPEVADGTGPMHFRVVACVRVSVSNPGRPQVCDLPASAFLGLTLQARGITSGPG